MTAEAGVPVPHVMFLGAFGIPPSQRPDGTPECCRADHFSPIQQQRPNALEVFQLLRILEPFAGINVRRRTAVRNAPRFHVLKSLRAHLQPVSHQSKTIISKIRLPASTRTTLLPKIMRSTP